MEIRDTFNCEITSLRVFIIFIMEEIHRSKYFVHGLRKKLSESIGQSISYSFENKQEVTMELNFNSRKFLLNTANQTPHKIFHCVTLNIFELP